MNRVDRRYLPWYCGRSTVIPLSEFERLVVEYSKYTEDEHLMKTCENLLHLLDEPAKNTKSLQIMHAIWVRTNMIRWHVEHRTTSPEIIEANHKVKTKAISKIEELKLIQPFWKVW
jgi:hypothetical protein